MWSNFSLNTFSTNLIGSLNIFEVIRSLSIPSKVIFITSDKCYENINKKVNYKENDRLGGLDPYSSSKASAELIIRSYYESYFKTKASNVRICSARAGNVMGGGDWAKYRIVPDCMKSWSEGKKVIIRNAKSTRPWQHVLEPISGYLTLAKSLSKDQNLNGEAFNFGPNSNSSHTVKELVDAGFDSIPVLDIDNINIGPYIRNTLAQDKNMNRETALMDIYRVMRPGEPPTVDAASALFDTLFFDSERYDLSAVGRVKMNMRLALDADDTQRTLRSEDIVSCIRALVELRDGRGDVDDIDHLGNRRVRSVGCLLYTSPSPRDRG